MKRLALTLLAGCAFVAALSSSFLLEQPAEESEPLVNFSHLRHLTERIEFKGQMVEIVRIYARYPDYTWLEAVDAGPEGIACVDDASRAAVLYLRHYTLTGDATSLQGALALLRFVLGMQADDGQFYNFIFNDYSINTEGRTSRKSFGWWAARAVWAMGEGFETMREADPEFARLLREGLAKTLPHVNALLERRGEAYTSGGYLVPRWLINGSAADATSELMLGLVAWYRAEPDSTLGEVIRAFAEGVMLMQDGDEIRFPYGLHRSWITEWHMYGNGQTEALASAGIVLNDSVMIASAEREARGFYLRLLIQGFMKWIDLRSPDERKEYEQIAYGIRPMALGLLRTHEATGGRAYATMAGLTAAWLMGNNVLSQNIYDPATGRCYDGISDSVSLNRDSGAESTIEALLTLLEIERCPEALRYLRYRRVDAAQVGLRLRVLFESPEGEQLALLLDQSNGSLTILEGNAAREYQTGQH